MTKDIQPHRQYTRRCRIEDILAQLYDAQLTAEVIVALVRPLGHGQLLHEIYRLRRDLDILKKHISAEWHWEDAQR